MWYEGLSPALCPITCSSHCKKRFCTAHTASHSCADYCTVSEPESVLLVTTVQPLTKKCSMQKCKKKITDITGYTCCHCGETTCMRHRSDHSFQCAKALEHFERERNKLKTEQDEIAVAAATKIARFISTAEQVLKSNYDQLAYAVKKEYIDPYEETLARYNEWNEQTAKFNTSNRRLLV